MLSLCRQGCLGVGRVVGVLAGLLDCWHGCSSVGMVVNVSFIVGRVVIDISAISGFEKILFLGPF